MSRDLKNYLIKYPLLSRYARNGLVNLNALARLVKETHKKDGKAISSSAVGMELRRYLSKQPKIPIKPFNFSKYSLQVVTRTNIHEIILNKTLDNRKQCLLVVNEISQTKYFVTLVEGEKEIVVMTDYPLNDLLNHKTLKKVINHYTDNLGFVSVNFPIELREVPGVYGLITSSLAEAGISIHSFHTIGGEILILVKNEELVRTQEVLQSLLFETV